MTLFCVTRALFILFDLRAAVFLFFRTPRCLRCAVDILSCIYVYREVLLYHDNTITVTNILFNYT